MILQNDQMYRLKITQMMQKIFQTFHIAGINKRIQKQIRQMAQILPKCNRKQSTVKYRLYTHSMMMKKIIYRYGP